MCANDSTAESLVSESVPHDSGSFLGFDGYPSDGYPAYQPKYDIEGVLEDQDDQDIEWSTPLDYTEPRTSRCGEFVSIQACIDRHNPRVVVYRCHRPDCSVCYESWAGREAQRATERLEGIEQAYRQTLHPVGQVVHLVVSPPQDWGLEQMRTRAGYERMKKRAYAIAKRAGLAGGACVFHPKRKRKRRDWYDSPHWHFVGFGWIQNGNDIFQDTGWIVKNKGVRESTGATISYLLTHAGIRHIVNSDSVSKQGHVLSWFGNCSYNQVSKISEVVESEEVICSDEDCSQPVQRWYGGWASVQDDEGTWDIDWNGAKPEDIVYITHIETRYRVRSPGGPG